MEKKRAAGITLIGSTLILYSLWQLLWWGGHLASIFLTDISIKENLLAILCLSLLCIFLIAVIVFAIRLMMHKGLARRLIVIISSIMFAICVVNLISIFKLDHFLHWENYGRRVVHDRYYFSFFGIIYYGIIAFYLTRPKVKEQFK